MENTQDIKMLDKNLANSYSRGIIDSYYGRPRKPKYYDESGQLVFENEMTTEQIKAYQDGYTENETFGGKKEW